MKKVLLLMTIFAVLLVNVATAHDTVMKLNFSFDANFNQDGWTNVIGGAEFPVVLDNGITIDYTGGNLAQGSSGEPESTVVPNNVSGSYNWWADTDADPAQFTIIGLDPAEKYTFLLYASRDDATASGDRTTTYSIIGSSISGSVNPVGNTDQFVTLTDIEPASSGAVVMEVTRLASTYGYINGWIILKQTDDVPVTTSSIDTLLKLNFSFDGFDQDGWDNVLGSDGFPVTSNGITVDVSGNHLSPGSSGEPVSAVVPGNVSVTYNWLSNGDDSPAQFTIVGLDANETYTFLIYSAKDGTQTTEDRTTTFTIVGSSPEISGSIDPVPNKDDFVVLSGIVPSASGAVVMDMTKLPGQYGYINALIIGKEKGTGVQELAVAASVYPNPVQDQLTLTNLSSGSLISVYSISGSKVLETWNGNKAEMKVGMGNLKTGVYLVNVKSGASVQSFKVVKK